MPTNAAPAIPGIVITNRIQDHIFRKKNLYLVPVIAAVALGSLYVPNFAVGLASGAALSAVMHVGNKTLHALKIVKSNSDSSFLKSVKFSPLFASLGLPVIDELVSRGVIQPAFARAIVWIAPAAAATFLGTPLSIATGVSIVATATFFSLFDLRNEHKHAPLHAVSSTFSGIAFGVLATQFGLGASIAAHVFYNTVIAAEITFSENY